jgi:hypothetical protein
MFSRFLLLLIKSFSVLNMNKNLKADLKGIELVLVTIPLSQMLTDKLKTLKRTYLLLKPFHANFQGQASFIIELVKVS